MTDTRNIAPKAAGYYAANAGLLCRNRLFAVIDSSVTDMCMYLVTANDNNFAVKAERCMPAMGVEPLTRAIAEKIVKTANLNHIIPADRPDMINAEIVRHYALSAKVIAFMGQNPDKESLKLNTNFECAPDQKQPVAISIPEIWDTAASYARQYSLAFNEFLAANNTRVIDLEKIILIGDTLASESVCQDFMRMADNDTVIYPGSKVPEIMAFEPATESDDEKTMIMPVQEQAASGNSLLSNLPPSWQSMLGNGSDAHQPQTPQTPQTPPAPPAPPKPVFVNEYRQVSQVVISQLASGTWVRLDTFDPTPGKGAAFQEMEYLGDGLFKVVASGRSLAPGDIAKPFAAAWQCEVQVDLEITRGPSSLGRFRTRVVKRISIKNFYE